MSEASYAGLSPKLIRWRSDAKHTLASIHAIAEQEHDYTATDCLGFGTATRSSAAGYGLCALAAAVAQPRTGEKDPRRFALRIIEYREPHLLRQCGSSAR
jgi:hypothetical protein